MSCTHPAIRERRWKEPMEARGRSCPRSYRYRPEALAGPARLEADTLYVVGGLYGNPVALRALLERADREPGGLPAMMFNGDCVHTHHRLLSEPSYLPLGTIAHKQGRIAGENALGGQASFAGSLGTQVVKVFDLAVARTGIRDAEAAAAGHDPVTVGSEEFDHTAYYPGARRLHLRVTGDRTTGRLLGAQVVGDHRAQVAKRIDIFATALFHRMTVEGRSDLDPSYTPPFGSP
jgi:NADPH-dependent 2,4-dienoyl-CoA reductase/sulfur reductase-like enzyme